MRAGDTVRYVPTGEEVVVAATKDERIAPAGYPPCTMQKSDCEVVKEATAVEHAEMLLIALEAPGWLGNWARDNCRALATELGLSPKEEEG